ncbi:MAG: 2-dehydropantoate 2-reductase N-terminal domain-containing protein, partial [Rhizobiaceae bacterium]
MAEQPLKIAVAGAGSIGCYVGGMLRADGHEVTFIGRPAIAERFARDGLHVQSMSGEKKDIDAPDLDFSLLPNGASDASHVLVCVKSMATREIAKALKPHLAENATVISLQNGLDNATVLQTVLTDQAVCAGMVSFNVVQQNGNRFIATTEGGIHLQRSDATAKMNEALKAADIDCQLHDDMTAVLW